MGQPSTPFVVNSKITFCEAEGDDAPRYTGLVKKTKESLVALIVSNKDKGALLPDVGAPIYFPFVKEGEAWQAVATVAQNSSWPLLILEVESEEPVETTFGEEIPVEQEATQDFPTDGSHLGDVEQADDDLISLPEVEEEEEPSVGSLTVNDELTDEELAAAEEGAAEALGGGDPLDDLPDMPDPLRDLPEVDDTDLAAELDADLADAMTQVDPVAEDGDSFGDDLDDMAMVATHDLEEGSEDDRVEQWVNDADEATGGENETVDDDQGPLLSWDQTGPADEVAEEEDTDDLAVDETAENQGVAPVADIDETATLPPGSLPEPEDDREFFPVTVHVGETATLPTGVDPAVAGIIDHLQRRLARLEANMGEEASLLPAGGANGFCLALAVDTIVVALPSGCALAEGDRVTVGVDHPWRDRLSFQLAATVASTHEEEGVAVVSFRFDQIDRESELAIEAYGEGIGDWRRLLARLTIG